MSEKIIVRQRRISQARKARRMRALYLRHLGQLRGHAQLMEEQPWQARKRLARHLLGERRANAPD